MTRVLLNFILYVVYCSAISGCIAVPLHSDENVHKTEWVIKRLVLDKASYSEVVSRLGTPVRQRSTKDENNNATYFNNVEYVICQTTGGLGILPLLFTYPATPGFDEPPLIEFRAEQECFEYVLEFDSNEILTGYSKIASTKSSSKSPSGTYLTQEEIRIASLRKQANDGYIESQYQLYYTRKTPVEERLMWLCRAADSGYPLAQAEVGRLYRWGLHGVKQDYRKAYNWYWHANKLSTDSWKSELQDARQLVFSTKEGDLSVLDLPSFNPGQCERELLSALQN